MRSYLRSHRRHHHHHYYSILCTHLHHTCCSSICKDRAISSLCSFLFVSSLGSFLPFLYRILSASLLLPYFLLSLDTLLSLLSLRWCLSPFPPPRNTLHPYSALSDGNKFRLTRAIICPYDQRHRKNNPNDLILWCMHTKTKRQTN